MILIISYLLLAYLLGSLSPAWIMGKLLKKIDIREYGSHNAGATNTIRVLGVKAGIPVIFLDFFKGFMVIWIGNQLNIYDLLVWAGGLFVIAGHIFPLFLGFRGGKGIASGAGMLTALYPLFFPVCLSLFLLVFFISGIVSLASLIAAASLLPVYLIAETIKNNPLDPLFILFTVFVFLIVAISHRKNWSRLIAGNESVFFKKKEGKNVGKKN